MTKINKRRPNSVPPAPGEVRRSPNRQRLIARVAVWSVAASGAAIWLPHVFA
jgi:hypothetical protein